MTIVGGLFSVGVVLVCGGVLFAAVILGIVLFYASRQKAQQVSATPPEPVIQATIEHPDAATTRTPPAPAPQAPPTPPAPPVSPTPPVPQAPPAPPAPPAMHDEPESRD